MTSNDAVLFSVEPVVTNQYIARAFFPSSSDSERNVLVADSPTTSGWSPDNILAHGLGPQCNGATADLSMSGTDREGVASVYGG